MFPSLFLGIGIVDLIQLIEAFGVLIYNNVSLLYIYYLQKKLKIKVLKPTH